MTTTTGVATEFITFTRASNATVTDSDGKVKWAPHNLLLNSESFDAAAWGSKAYVTANAAVAPNGTTTADRINNTGVADNVAQTATVSPGVAYTFSFWAKNNGGTTASYRVYDNTNFADIVAVTSYFSLINGSTWTQITVTFTAPAGCTTANCYVSATNGTTNNVFIWGASLYRSDLAMQPNTSAYPMYNPTTPKNLLGYTEDFSNAAWIKPAGTTTINPNQATAPDGTTTADLVTAIAGTAFHYFYQTNSASGSVTATIYAKAGTANWLGFGSGYTNGAETAWFNLSTGTCGAVAAGGTSTMTDAGNGWWRCSHTRSSWTGGAIIAFITNANSATAFNAAGTETIYLWGAQLSDSASLDPYVPVYGAAVTSAAYYGPRRDFDPVTLACKGLLVEEQRVNLLLYSEDFTNGAWTPSNFTVSGNTTAPSGTSTADLVYPTASGDYCYAYQSPNQTGLSSISVYAKASGKNVVWAYLKSAAEGGVAYFDLSDQTTQVVAGSVSTFTATISPVGNGWYRLIATASASFTGVYPAGFGISDAKGSQSITKSGTSGVYLWGAQLDSVSGGNAPFATSYIPTGAATATRNADVASVSTQAFPYSQTEGTWVANFQTIFTGAAPLSAWIVGADNSNSKRIMYMPATDDRVRSFDGSTEIIATGDATGAITKSAAAFGQTDRALVTNGGTVATGAVAAGYGTASVATLGSSNSLSALNGHIRQITYLPRRISNIELQTRTS